MVANRNKTPFLSSKQRRGYLLFMSKASEGYYAEAV